MSKCQVFFWINCTVHVQEQSVNSGWNTMPPRAPAPSDKPPAEIICFLYEICCITVKLLNSILTYLSVPELAVMSHLKSAHTKHKHTLPFFDDSINLFQTVNMQVPKITPLQAQEHSAYSNFSQQAGIQPRLSERSLSFRLLIDWSSFWGAQT